MQRCVQMFATARCVGRFSATVPRESVLWKYITCRNSITSTRSEVLCTHVFPDLACDCSFPEYGPGPAGTLQQYCFVFQSLLFMKANKGFFCLFFSQPPNCTTTVFRYILQEFLVSGLFPLPSLTLFSPYLFLFQGISIMVGDRVSMLYFPQG